MSKISTVSGILDIADFIRRYKEMFGEPKVVERVGNGLVGLSLARQKERFAKELNEAFPPFELVLYEYKKGNNLFLLFKDKFILEGNEDDFVLLIADYIDSFRQLPGFIDNLFFNGIEKEMRDYYRYRTLEKEEVLFQLADSLSTNKEALRKTYNLTENFLAKIQNNYPSMQNIIHNFRYSRNNSKNVI